MGETAAQVFITSLSLMAVGSSVLIPSEAVISQSCLVSRQTGVVFVSICVTHKLCVF